MSAPGLVILMSAAAERYFDQIDEQVKSVKLYLAQLLIENRAEEASAKMEPRRT